MYADEFDYYRFDILKQPNLYHYQTEEKSYNIGLGKSPREVL